MSQCLWLIRYLTLLGSLHPGKHLLPLQFIETLSPMVIFHFLSRILPHLPTLMSLSSASGLKMNRYFESKSMSHEYYKTNPWTWSGAPHLANGLCPFGITANLMWRPRHWAVWIDPGTNTWLLFRQNARQNVFNWVLCSHFSQFQTDKVHILGRNHYSQLKFTIAVWLNVWKLSLTPTVFLSMVHCSNIFGQSDLFAAIDFNSDDDWAFVSLFPQ